MNVRERFAGNRGLFRRLAKNLFRSAGLNVTRRDLLEEQIPEMYFRSPFLPPICRFSAGRLLYFQHLFELADKVAGDIVECGVSIGYGLLNWALLCQLRGSHKRIYGFDSFEGFPPAAASDRKQDGTFQTEVGEFASPPELVIRILKEGGVSDQFVHDNVRLIKGYFDSTLPGYRGSISLLHLDCDLYQSYRTCLQSLYDRVVPGGVIAFDEYEDANFPGARRAIDEFFQNKPEKPGIYGQFGVNKYFVVKK